MTPDAGYCAPCYRHDHDKCVGLGCNCRETSRCEANALLTEEREAS